MWWSYLVFLGFVLPLYMRKPSFSYNGVPRTEQEWAAWMAGNQICEEMDLDRGLGGETTGGDNSVKSIENFMFKRRV